MQGPPEVRCLCAAVACVALLTLRAAAEEGAPRAVAAPVPAPAATPSPLEDPAPFSLGNVSPRGYDDFLYGSAGENPPAPSADDADSWTSALDRFSLLEMVTGEPQVPDFYHSGSGREPCCPECQACRNCDEPWSWSLIPEGLIYRSYLAGPKEPRFTSIWLKDQNGGGWLQDVTLGGRVGILRFGNQSAVHPEGWQLDVEGAGMPRLDLNDDRRDLNSADFRFGVPLTYGIGRYQMKFAYYHLSSHMGDELLIRLNLGSQRINYVRDALVWGHSYFLTPEVRTYLEFEYAYNVDGGAEPWAIQCGVEFAPPCPTGPYGAPFAAVNAYLLEEQDFGGIFTAQAGWCWRSSVGRLFRVGVHYLNGSSPQLEFFREHEQQFGLGLWYDY